MTQKWNSSGINPLSDNYLPPLCNLHPDRKQKVKALSMATELHRRTWQTMTYLFRALGTPNERERELSSQNISKHGERQKTREIKQLGTQNKHAMLYPFNYYVKMSTSVAHLK